METNFGAHPPFTITSVQGENRTNPRGDPRAMASWQRRSSGSIEKSDHLNLRRSSSRSETPGASTPSGTEFQFQKKFDFGAQSVQMGLSISEAPRIASNIHIRGRSNDSQGPPPQQPMNYKQLYEGLLNQHSKIHEAYRMKEKEVEQMHQDASEFKRIKHLPEELNKMRVACSQLSQERDSLQMKLTQLSGGITREKNEMIAGLQFKAERLEKELSQLRAQNEKMRKNEEELAPRFRILQSESSNLLGLLNSLKREKSEILKQKEAIQETMRQSEIKWRNELEEKQKEIEKMVPNFSFMPLAFSENKEETEQLRKENERLKGEQLQLNGELIQLKGGNWQLKKEVEGLNEAMMNLRVVLSGWEQRAETAEKELERTKGELESMARKSQEENGRVHGEMYRLKAETDSTKFQLESAKKEVDYWRQKSSEKEATRYFSRTIGETEGELRLKEELKTLKDSEEYWRKKAQEEETQRKRMGEEVEREKNGKSPESFVKGQEKEEEARKKMEEEFYLMKRLEREWRENAEQKEKEIKELKEQLAREIEKAKEPRDAKMRTNGNRKGMADESGRNSRSNSGKGEAKKRKISKELKNPKEKDKKEHQEEKEERRNSIKEKDPVTNDFELKGTPTNGQWEENQKEMARLRVLMELSQKEVVSLKEKLFEEDKNKERLKQTILEMEGQLSQKREEAKNQFRGNESKECFEREITMKSQKEEAERQLKWKESQLEEAQRREEEKEKEIHKMSQDILELKAKKSQSEMGMIKLKEEMTQIRNGMWEMESKARMGEIQKEILDGEITRMKEQESRQFYEIEELKRTMADLQMKLQISESSAMQMSLNVGSAEKLEAQNKELRDQVQIWMNRCNELEQNESRIGQMGREIEQKDQELKKLKESTAISSKELDSAKLVSMKLQSAQEELVLLKERMDDIQNELESVCEQRDQLLLELKSRPGELFFQEKQRDAFRQAEIQEAVIRDKSAEIHELQRELDKRAKAILEAQQKEAEMAWLKERLAETSKENEELKKKIQELQVKVVELETGKEDSCSLKSLNEDLRLRVRQLEEETVSLVKSIEKSKREMESKKYLERNNELQMSSKLKEMEEMMEILKCENERATRIALDQEKHILEMEKERGERREREVRTGVSEEERKEMEKRIKELQEEILRNKVVFEESAKNEKEKWEKEKGEITLRVRKEQEKQIERLNGEVERAKEEIKKSKEEIKSLKEVEGRMSRMEKEKERLEKENEKLHGEYCQRLITKKEIELHEAKGESYQFSNKNDMGSNMSLESKVRLLASELAEVKEALKRAILSNHGNESEVVKLWKAEVERLNKRLAGMNRENDQLRVKLVQFSAQEEIDKSVSLFPNKKSLRS